MIYSVVFRCFVYYIIWCRVHFVDVQTEYPMIKKNLVLPIYGSKSKL